MLGLGGGLTGGAALDSVVTPDSISDLAFWYKNNTEIDAARWSDQSDNNNHMGQGTSGNQASVSGGGFLFVDDNSDHYDLSTAVDIGASNAFTMICVMNLNSYDSQNMILGDNNELDKFLDMQNVDQMRFRQSGTAAVLKFAEEGNFPTGATYMITVTKDTSRNLVVYKNGEVLEQESSTGTPVASGAFSVDQIGGRGSAPDRDFDGYMYELLLYTKLLSTAELSGVHSEIQARIGF